MSSIRVTVLGSSSAAGTNLSSPTTERYAALFQTWLRANRNSHCRVQVVALAGIGLYEQQATGFSIPGNRSGQVSVNTSVNITFALAQKPHLLVLHQPAGNLPEALANWGFTTQSGLEGFVNSEQGALVDNIANACASAGVEFRVLGSHPLVESVMSQAQLDANYQLVQRYWDNWLLDNYGSRCVSYFDDVVGGDTYGNSSLYLVDGHHLNTTGLAFPEAGLEALGFDTWNDPVSATDIDP